ncbi:MAG: ATP-dependent helicase Lhr and Lhr-like helicase, partial [Ilumatobacteraceae bacterium]
NLPLGLPLAFTEPVAHPLESLVARYARTHGPFTASDVSHRLATPLERIIGALAALEADGRVVHGEFRPNGVGREYCDADVLRQLRRRSLATLRREVEPVEPEAYARFIQQWHGIPGERRGLDSLVEVLGQLQGAALVASALETELLPARLRTYRAADLDELCTTGDVVWVGAGAVGPADGRIRLFFADQFAVLDASLEATEPPAGPLHDAIRAHLASHGASFWNQLRAAANDATDLELLAALWDLVWAGEVSNDSLAALRAILSGGKSHRTAAAARGRPRPGRLTRIGPPAGAGRWSLVAPQRVPVPSPTQAAHASALQLLERYGVVTREAVLAEGVKGGYSATYGVLKVLEERGQVRRGYFVAGLGAAQFALPGAVDRLRSARGVADAALHPELVPAPVVLASTDPAQPYGAALDWPETPGRPSRTAGAVVVLRSGIPLAWFDRRSSHLVTFPGSVDGSWADALASLVKDGRQRSIEVRKVNGSPIDRKGAEAVALLAAGFADGYRGLVLRGV